MRRSSRVSTNVAQGQFEEGIRVFYHGPLSQPLAVGLFQRAAAAGHAAATAWLAECHFRGDGVDKDEDEARRLAAIALGERQLRTLAEQVS